MSSLYGLPGNKRRLKEPSGYNCGTEGHEDRPAVFRVQGETDSFGCEYEYFCQECGVVAPNHWFTGTCPKCGKGPEEPLYGYRDPDEGLGGPVYPACRECRDKELRQQRLDYEAEEEHFHQSKFL